MVGDTDTTIPGLETGTKVTVAHQHVWTETPIPAPSLAITITVWIQTRQTMRPANAPPILKHISVTVSVTSLVATTLMLAPGMAGIAVFTLVDK